MIENLDTLNIFYIFGLPINATIFYTWIVMAILVIAAKLSTRHLKTSIKISRFQMALEMIVMAVRQEIKSVSSENPIKYLPIIATFFIFIAFCNILTIFPFFKTPTSSLSTTAAFAFFVFLAIPYYGIKNAGVKKYLRKYIEPVAFMLPMNILSDVTSIFAMAFRLYGNVLGGILVVSILLSLAPLFPVLPIPLQLLGLFTGTIQAYVFALLAIIYISSISSQEIYEDHLKNY